MHRGSGTEERLGVSVKCKPPAAKAAPSVVLVQNNVPKANKNKDSTMTPPVRRWSEAGETSVPYWVYTDDGVYRTELERIWYGEHWLYAGLEVEVPEIGSYRTTTLGERPVVVVRSAADQISVLENRCCHRAVLVCQARFGRDAAFTCPYHQWNYALDGSLQGVPFRRGVRGKGGMPSEFNPKNHGLRRLRVEVVNGVIWASFSDRTPSFREYLGEKLWRHYERIFNGRRLRVMGYNRQLIPSNWKLMMENNKDPYHVALLHVFLATFGLYRPDQAAHETDETGRHACLMSVAPSRDPSASADNADVTAGLPRFDSGLKLADRRIVDAVNELEGDETVGSSSIFPGAILIQQVNSLQTRQIIPRGPGTFEFVWTHFGFEDDDEEMRRRRVRHANLFGPAGLVSVDDSEVLAMAQKSFASAAEGGASLMQMGGSGVGAESTMATESAIRSMYRYYRSVMGL
jgi:salicylate 5-hydroxylase large subunit